MENEELESMKEEVRKNTRWRRFQQWICILTLIFFSLWIVWLGLNIIVSLFSN